MVRILIVWLITSIVFTAILCIFTMRSFLALGWFPFFIMYIAPILLVCAVPSSILIEKVFGKGNDQIIKKLLAFGILGIVAGNALYYFWGDVFNVLLTHLGMNIYSLLAALIFGCFTFIIKSKVN